MSITTGEAIDAITKVEMRLARVREDQAKSIHLKEKRNWLISTASIELIRLKKVYCQTGVMTLSLHRDLGRVEGLIVAAAFMGFAGDNIKTLFDTDK